MVVVVEFDDDGSLFVCFSLFFFFRCLPFAASRGKEEIEPAHSCPFANGVNPPLGRAPQAKRTTDKRYGGPSATRPLGDVSGALLSTVGPTMAVRSVLDRSRRRLVRTFETACDRLLKIRHSLISDQIG